MADFGAFNATSKPIIYVEDDWNSLLAHGLEKTATYIIRKNGSYYESLKGGTTSDAGTIEYGGPDSEGAATGTDPQAVFQATLDAMTSGGILFVKAGAYDFGTSSCTVGYGKISIIGEGKATQITGDTHGNGAFYFYSAGGGLTDFTVQNIYFTGDDTDAESHALIFNACDRITVKDCIFEDMGDESIVLMKSCRNGIISHNKFLNSGNAGAGQGSPINLQSGHHIIDGNIMTLSTATPGIHLEAIAGTEEIEDVIIKNNIIYGASTGTCGIQLNATAYDISNITVSDNKIYDCIYAGIVDNYFAGGANNVNHVVVTGNYIEGGGSDASARGAITIVKNSPTDVIISNNTVKDWDAQANDHGIYVICDNGVIADNHLEDIGHTGIDADIRGSITGNVITTFATNGIHARNKHSITGNNLYNSAGAGIRLAATADYCSITGNTIESVTTPFFNGGGANSIVKNNVGYITENCGTGTITNGTTSVVITHGLATTPTTVQALGNGFTDVVDLYSSAVGATQFTINTTAAVGGDRTIYWYAQLKP